MTGGDSRRRDYLALAISLAIGVAFIYAGASKLRDPLQFADSIAAFALLPAVLINLMALTLPPFEIACGLLMLRPRTRRVAALALALTAVMFFSALVSALARGLTLDCGCFGVGAPSRPRMWLESGLNILLFAGALTVYLRSTASRSIRSRAT
ncbi:MAG TPA: MauE/DoxX family redox-associated membrane protein [Candidatus Binataceae bacterium]|nr:MauE/DoxX family redox-associated membrane protein [Candidatus Binataceae bacterium]